MEMTKVATRASLTVGLTVNGTDYSDYFVSASAGFSSIEVIGTGVSYMTGTLQITQEMRRYINLDPRTNIDFRPGNEIVIFDNDSTGLDRLPVCGTSYIINSTYDFRRSLTISFGCILSVKNSTAPQDFGLCIDFNAEQPVGDTIYSMLVLSGIPETVISQQGFLDLNRFKLAVPFLIGSQQSIIQSLGSLLRQYGKIVVQDKNGQVFLKDLLVDTNYVVFAKQSEAVSYEIAPQPEQAVNILRVNYSQVKPINELGVTSNNVRSGDVIVSSLVARDDDFRTVTSTITESRFLPSGVVVPVSETIETSTFEVINPVVRAGQFASFDECYPEDQARILTKETVTKTDNTETLKSWLSYQAQAAIPSGFTPTATVTSARKVETYTYTSTQITIDETLFEPIAKSFPVIGDLQLTSSNAAIADINPETEVVATKKLTIYYKSSQLSNVYKKVTLNFVNRALVDITGLLNQALESGTSLQTIVDDSTELVQSERLVEFNQSLPSFETYQSDTEVVEETQELFFGSDLDSGIRVNSDLGQYLDPPVEIITELGIRQFNWLNGRVFSCSAGLVFPDRDRWVQFVPYTLSKIIERDDTGYIYRVDTPGITIAPEEFVISFTGILAGTSAEGATLDFYSDRVVRLPGIPSPFVTETYEFADVDYTLEYRGLSVSPA